MDGAFVGCATDSRYVDLTSVMLSSLDDNGAVPEAQLLVSDFGLDERDRETLRKASGRFGEAMRFVPVTRSSPEIVALPRFDFPFPLMGRLVLPQVVTTPRSRLVLLDSDMVVNHSLRPLFEMHMRGHAIAAVHDSISWREHYGRPAKTHYFNAGMMMIDTDRYRQQDIAARAMRRLAEYEQPPMWLEQDALNDVVGDQWLSLDRRWNFFHAGDYRSFTYDDYAAAAVAHFSGPKLWDNPDHAGAPLFHHHAARAEAKILHRVEASPGTANRVFAASCYEVLLGRQLESPAVLADRAGFSQRDHIAAIIGSPEFQDKVLAPITAGEPLPTDRFRQPPTLAQRYWAVERLPMLESTAKAVEQARSWREVLTPLLRDRHFMGVAKLPPIAEPPVTARAA